MKVLVVEDDRKVAGFIEQGLSEEGHVVDLARDGEEATMLALRTRGGVPAGPAADSLVADGLAEHRDGRVVLTPGGRLLANEATTRLLGASTSC